MGTLYRNVANRYDFDENSDALRKIINARKKRRTASYGGKADGEIKMAVWLH